MTDGRSTTIAVTDRPGEVAHKITKVVAYREGGFGVLVPYHNARVGYLFKHQIDYRERTQRIPRSEVIEYGASDRVKLSFHPDGFVQFSGENAGKIMSGRDETGAPKGLGLMLEHPLFKPIASGPTFSLTIWGLHDFEAMKQTDERNAIIFGEDDFYYRGCTPRTWNSYVVEVFIIPQQHWAGIRSRTGRLVLTAAFGGFEVHGAVFDLLIIPLARQPILLGVICSRSRSKFPVASGFVLSSPTDRREGQPLATAMVALYPAPHDARRSLDHKQPAD